MRVPRHRPPLHGRKRQRATERLRARGTRPRSPVAGPGAVLAAGVLVALLAVRAPALLAFAVPACAVVLALVALARWAADQPDRRRLTAWTLGGFGMHLALGLVIWSSPTLTGYFGGDALTYHAGASALLQHWTAGAASPALPAGKEGFFYLLGGLYWIFGAHPDAGLVVDAGMAAATVPVLFDTTRRLFGRTAAGAVPVIATLLPGFIIWGSQLLREAGVYLFTAVCLACAARLRERLSALPFLAFTASATLLVAWRADVGLLVAGGLVVGLVLGRGANGPGLVSGPGVAALVLALVAGLGLGYSGYHLVTHTSLAQLNDIRSGSSTSASSGFLPASNISTTAHAAGYLPLGSLYFVLGPLPWQIHGGRQLFGVPDTLAWWFLLPSLWRGARAQWRAERLGVLLLTLPALALGAALSLIVANFGTTVRERVQVVVLLVPLIAYGWSLRRRRAPSPEAALTPVGPA